MMCGLLEDFQLVSSCCYGTEVVQRLSCFTMTSYKRIHVEQMFFINSNKGTYNTINKHLCQTDLWKIKSNF